MSVAEQERTKLEDEQLTHLQFFFNSIPNHQLEKYDIINWETREGYLILSYSHPSYNSKLRLKLNLGLVDSFRSTQIQTIRKVITNVSDLEFSFQKDHLNFLCNGNEEYNLPFLNEQYRSHSGYDLSSESVFLDITDKIKYLDKVRTYFGNLAKDHERINWYLEGQNNWIYFNSFDKICIHHQDIVEDLKTNINLSFFMEQIDLMNKLLELPKVNFRYYGRECVIRVDNDYVDFYINTHKEYEENFTRLKALTDSQTPKSFKINISELTYALQKVNHILSKFDNKVTLTVADSLKISAYSPLSGQIDIVLSLDNQGPGWELTCSLKVILNLIRKFEKNTTVRVDYVEDKSVLMLSTKELSYLILIN